MLASETVLRVGEKQRKVYFDYLRMELVDEGLLISAKAHPLFSEAIKAAGERNYPTGWRSKSKSKLFIHKLGLPERFSYILQSGGIAPLWVGKGEPMMFWLMDTKLAEGMQVLYPVPVPPNDLEDYFTSCCTYITDIFNTLMRRPFFHAEFAVVDMKELDPDAD